MFMVSQYVGYMLVLEVFERTNGLWFGLITSALLFINYGLWTLLVLNSALLKHKHKYYVLHSPLDFRAPVIG